MIGMHRFEKLYCSRWNIGFIEQPVAEIVTGAETEFDVKWVKHRLTDRFFADPFILSVEGGVIKVLVEEYFYNTKKGIITLLEVDAATYELRRRKVVLEQPYHQSFPYIHRDGDRIYVLPEASASGCLYRYEYDAAREELVNRQLVVEEPLLDSTFVELDGKWWLLCTKRGGYSNRGLFVFESERFEGPYSPINGNSPVIVDWDNARPAGYIERIDGKVYRSTQVCNRCYGEYMKIFEVEAIDESGVNQKFVKEIHPKRSKYSESFHTVNGYGNITVVDGVNKSFRPLFKLWTGLEYKLKRM